MRRPAMVLSLFLPFAAQAQDCATSADMKKGIKVIYEIDRSRIFIETFPNLGKSIVRLNS